MTTETTDRIEKQVLLRAPRERVWRALTDAEQFGAWFGVAFDRGATFAPGARVQGKVTHEGYEHLTWDVTIERMEPQRLFSWHWHPHPIDPQRDYEAEPTTQVVFELEEVAGGTRLTVTESGFDTIPLERRAEAYRGNEEGWEWQMESIARYVAEAP
ncbi:MAG TPA: SRPBCC family protein [Chloroflexota bacterium]|jgi:uncharacterized protein YndB with AHSA1/START domain|nr:SRPBCC family protein [Chloroflexota bacterium]